MPDLVLFLHAVSAHWIAYLGVFLTLTPLAPPNLRKRAEQFMKLKFTFRHLWMVGGFLLFISFYQAWQDEHRNTQVVIAQRQADSARANMCELRYKLEDAYAKGLSGSNLKQQQNLEVARNLLSNQQSTLNTCVVAMAKVNAPVPLKTDVKARTLPIKGGPNRTVLILTANKRIAAHGELICSKPFRLAFWVPTDEDAAREINVNMPNDHSLRLDIKGDYISPGNPFLIFAIGQTSLDSCNFTPG